MSTQYSSSDLYQSERGGRETATFNRRQEDLLESTVKQNLASHLQLFQMQQQKLLENQQQQPGRSIFDNNNADLLK